MKISLFLICAFCILDGMFTEAYPRTYDPFPNQHQNCIKMTPEVDKEINVMVDEITDFINELAVKHENFDVRLVIVNIEQHSDDEPEDKNTVLQLNVNDCPKEIVTKSKQNSEDLNQNNQENEVEINKNQNDDGSKLNNEVNKVDEKLDNSDDTLTDNNDFTVEIDFDVNENDEEANEQSNNNDKDIQTDDENNDDFDEGNDAVMDTDAYADKNEERVTSRPEFMHLDLPSEIHEVLDKIEKKKGKITPLIMYVQGEQGENQNYVFLNTK